MNRLGLFALDFVPKGTFLFDYTGEKLTKVEYDVRYPSGVSDYTVGMRTPAGRMDFIDGRDSDLGAPARYMNHDSQCVPRLQPRPADLRATC